MPKYDIEASRQAQENYFASDGKCFSYRKNSYQLIGNTGISVEKAGSEHITSCPHCHRTFLD
ncbi:hypothetical protein P4H32_29395 [Bacillus cereus]|nr:hypothetical protein [Bacillus cereus]